MRETSPRNRCGHLVISLFFICSVTGVSCVSVPGPESGGSEVEETGTDISRPTSADKIIELEAELDEVRAESRELHSKSEELAAENEELRRKLDERRDKLAAAEQQLALLQEKLDALLKVSKPPNDVKTEQEIYEVQENDTLAGIAAKPEVYGDSSRWLDIYEANKDRIDDPGVLTVGLKLVIPRP